MFGDGFDGSFGGIVSGIAGWIRDTLFRTGDDDGGGLALCAEGGEEGRNAVDDAEKVCIHYLRPSMCQYTSVCLDCILW